MEAAPLLPPLPVFPPAGILFCLLSLLRPAYTKDSRRDETVAGKVAAVQLYLQPFTLRKI